MADLCKVIESTGFENPKALLQSGNCVFETEMTDLNEVEKLLESASEAAFGFSVSFYARTQKQLKEALDANPFPEMAADDPSHLVLHFFKTPPQESEVAEINWQGPEKLKLIGEVLYISCPNGIGTSELFKNRSVVKLLKTATARNWTTVSKLHEMTLD